jgi:hypothetical protein
VRQKLSVPALSAVLVLSSGVVFPIIFTVTDRLLRELFSAFHPTLLLIASFSWLLLFYFYGIKFSLEYVSRQFEVSDRDKLFKYSNIGFSAVAVLFYASLLSSSILSNILWGSFYLATIGLFYWLSSRELLRSST